MTSPRPVLGSYLLLTALVCLSLVARGASAQQQAPAQREDVSMAVAAPGAGEDDSLASRVFLRGETLANGTYRLAFRYEPGRGVRDSLGGGGLEHLGFLVYSQPSRSLLALFLCGGDEEEAARRGAAVGALTTFGLPWGGSLQATAYLPHLPESDKSISVELSALGRHARIPGGEELSIVSFDTVLPFREMSLLEGGEPEG